MSDFIEELKQEHEVIGKKLRKVVREGVHTMEGRNQLLETRDCLMAHLKKENQYLLPSLELCAKKDERLQSLLVSYARDLKTITRFCDDFFEKYSTSGGGIEFFRDFDEFRKSLTRRIQQEEKELFPRYEQMECQCVKRRRSA